MGAVQLSIDFDNIPLPWFQDGTGPRCPWCGEERFTDVFEYWAEERAWMFDTCCEGSHDDLREQADDDPRSFGKWFEARTGRAVRRSYHSEKEMAMRLDYGLELREIELGEAKAFVTKHHRHHKASLGWRWGHAVYNGETLVGVAMVGRPVARLIDGTKAVEVNRLCINSELDKALVWNACSMLYGAAAREAKRRGFERILTYILETEDGTTLKAAGWTRTRRTKGGSWNSPSRARTDKAPTCRKWRYERALNKRGTKELGR